MSATQETRVPRRSRQDEAAALLWLLCGWVLLIAYLFVQTKISRETAIAGMVVAGAAVVWRLATRTAGQSGPPLTVAAASTAVATAGTFINFHYAVGGVSSPGLLAAAALACAFVLASAAWPRTGSFGVVTPALLVISANFVLTALYLRGHPVRIDVEVVLREGVGELIAGHNPYAMTFTNPYTPEESRLFFAPGILVDNRISLGFPYPPIVLLSAVPGYVLGDVRLSGLILVTLLALTVHGRGRSRVQRSQAVALATAPGTLFVLSNAWTETLSVVLLGFAMLAFRRKSVLIAGALLAAFLVSKQYLVVLLPCLWMLRAHARRASVAAFCAAGAALTLPWVFADLPAFWRAVSGAHAGGLVRPDSISLLVEGVVAWGWGESPVYRWLPVGVGLTVSIVLAACLRQGPRNFAAAVGVAVMATVLVSKQSFFNYYYLVAMSLAVAATVGAMRFSTLPQKAPAKSLPEDETTASMDATRGIGSPADR